MIGHSGDSLELQGLRDADRSTDGVVSMTRAHSAEQEMLRDGMTMQLNPVHRKDPRGRLLSCAEESPAVLRGWSITPLDDRILVEFASFKEGYVCTECKGSGMGEEVCASCGGTAKYVSKRGHEAEACSDCRIVGFEGLTRYSCGWKPCSGCKGTGLAPGVMAIPDSSKQDHSYGDILTVGASVFDLRPGDRVVFSKMAGIYVKGDTRNCCLLRRGEVMGLMRKK